MQSASTISNLFDSNFGGHDLASDSSLSRRQPLATTFLASAIKCGKLAHAYLLTGKNIDDAWQIAIRLAAFLNCEKRRFSAFSSAPPEQLFAPAQLSCLGRQQKPDSYCLNCRWIAENRHPQALITVGTAEGKSSKIAVEKIRLLTDELMKESQFTRIVVITDARQEILHRPAANALLKTMEEPKSQTLFLLFADNVKDVLPTVVSRCQVIPLNASLINLRLIGKPPTFKNSATSASKNAVHRELQEKNKAASKDNETEPALDYEKTIDHILVQIEGREHKHVRTYLQSAKEIEQLIDDNAEFADILDTILAREIDHLHTKILNDLSALRYLQELMELCEDAKLKISQFVSIKAVIEVFFVSLWRLRKKAAI